MATAVFLAVDNHSSIGEYKVSLIYDTGTLQILSATVLNTTGDPQPITVGNPPNQFTGTIANGTNTTVSLTSFNVFMVNTNRGPRPPLFIG